MRGLGRALRVSAAAACATTLALAAPASADTFVVDDIADADDADFPHGPDAECDADPGAGVSCTLRAAIQTANDTSSPDTIKFSSALVSARATVVIDSSALGGLPEISQPMLLDGCGGALLGKPCVTVREEAPGGTVDVLSVGATGVTIRGLALGNGRTGILLNGAAGTRAVTNAIGTNATGSLEIGNHGPGIRIRDDAGDGGDNDPAAEGNVIGGSTAGSENVISFNAGPGVEVLPALNGSQQGGPTSDLNFVGRNRGEDNGGPFIDLGGDGFGNPSAQNDGIRSPIVDVAAPEFARGTASPGATVLVFQTSSPAGADPTSLGPFLGSVSADAAGNWRVDHGAGLGPNVRVSALQADASLAACEDLVALCNSSELARATPVDSFGPMVSVTAGPSGATNDPTPSFEFTADPGTTVVCGVPGSIPYEACGSPTDYTASSPLVDGDHVFEVVGFDEAGNTTTATRSFTVDTFIRTAIRRAPNERRVKRYVVYKFRAEEAGTGDDEDRFVEEPGATFACSLDRRPFKRCRSPKRYTHLRRGHHRFRVVAADEAGNEDESPARDGFTIVHRHGRNK